ncbi:MAG TPA: hypothetical protein VN699_21895 [Pirellulales bacterium]|nr:hypothetical protein [Pirellulales bacterium]
MNVLTPLLMGLVAFGAAPAEGDGPDAQALWRARYQRAAEEYKLFRDPELSERLELRADPVYRWNHAAQDGGLSGSIYVWTHRGCAEAVACFWQMKYADGTSTLGHELHALSPKVLSVSRQGPERWKPAAALARIALDEAPAPASKPAGRLAQIRSIGSEFSGYGVNAAGERREFRLLTTPVYRYQSSDPDVLDGALFAMVCTVGADPEVFLLVEARRTAEGPRWQFALARFSHLNLFVSRGGREVWRAVRGPNDTFAQNADQTYRSFHVAPRDE